MADGQVTLKPDEGQSNRGAYMDFVSPLIAVSAIAAIFLLFWPEQSLLYVENLFRNGHLRWIVGMITIAGSVSALFVTKRSTLVLLLDTVASALVCTFFVLRFGAHPYVETTSYFPAGRVELFAYFYFIFVVSLLVPSVCRSILETRLNRWLAANEETPRQKGGQALPG